MKPFNQYSKLYQTDLYDQIKEDGNHIVCLGQDQTRTFLLLAAIRNRAHQLHLDYGAFVTVIVEPDHEHAEERQRMINDHTELPVTNLFNCDSVDKTEEGGIIILSVQDVLNEKRLLSGKRFNLVILDFAHLLLIQDVKLVQSVVRYFEKVQLLAFMCSLIHNNHELTPISTVQLINRLESIFSAKCETSSDLRSLSRQSPVTNMEIVEFNSNEVTCDWFLLSDAMLKQFCDFILDTTLDDDEPLIKPDTEISHPPCRQPALTIKKQLALVRSCLADIIYAIYCLGLWCTKKTIQLYLTEFNRLLQNEPPVGDLIAGASTILNCFYGRLDELTTHYSLRSKIDIVVESSTKQLRSILDFIKEFKPTSNTTWPICVIHVRRRVMAKVIALWLDKVASNCEEYSFIKPNYIVASSRKHRNRMAVDNFDLHHETSIRDFRFGNCNTLVTSAMSERCMDIPRCHLVVSFDLPIRFSDFIQAKGNCRYDGCKYVIMLNEFLSKNSKERLLSYINMERLLNNVNKKVTLESEESILESLEARYAPYPARNSKNPVTIWRSMSMISKYCAKLPSDSFTKLSPEWYIKEVEGSTDCKEYICEMRLPINSPVRQTIVGAAAPTKNVAMRLAAFTACKVLHAAGELDDNMMPITKESMKTMNPLGKANQQTYVRPPRMKGAARGQATGSTKHRQYYKKRIAEVFSGPLVSEGITCYLYEFKMILTCPIPDEQNRRGRRIIDPSETSRNYAIVCTKKLPKICSFPVFTRSGEVMISVELIENGFRLNSKQVEDLRTFHKFTFSKVLRLEKYPTIYDPSESPFTVLLAPVLNEAQGSSIDWKFVDKIVLGDKESQVPTEKDRKSFKFNHMDYVDAVVIPWYRVTDRQQFAYYVAEICTELNPKSQFPDESSGFETFMDYYKSKYDIVIYNTNQPVLDVDHTSARLNLLTPRYVNRKGRTLPSSTAKTRRESRESLVQKQLLIPELCSIHPFPASFWRKAVCLPCIFYRLNSLFLAEELRRKVAEETHVGFVEPAEDFQWPPLDFGWSLKDVINNQLVDDDSYEENAGGAVKEIKKEAKKRERKAKIPTKPLLPDPNEEVSRGEDFVIDYFDPSKYDIPDIPLDAPPQDWMNIKLISSGNTTTSDGPSGWDQPLEQHDLLLEHTNEISWSDCEMDYEGEITEKVPQLRCGSPSAFELEFKNLPDAPYKTSKLSFNTSATLNKTVKFDESSKSSSDADNEQEMAESSTSWTISDEDDNAENGNSDEELRCYGEWKDSKSKNLPLLRDLYLPSTKTMRGSTASDIETLYEIMKEVSCGGEKEASEPADNTVKCLTAKTISSSEDYQLMESVINEICEQKLVLEKEQVEKSFETWNSIFIRLCESVDSDLAKDPDMFKDSGAELVSVDDSFSNYRLETQPTFGELLPNRDVECEYTSEDWKSIKFDPTRKELKSNGPGPSIILQALTMSNASDGINLERLETVGDSFLKYSITAFLYCMCPDLHEGRLSYYRSLEISNANLYTLGNAKNLGELMSATKFEPNDNWLAPGYSVADKAPKDTIDCNKKKEIDKALKEVPYDLLLQHSIPDKSIADCVEALIGTYLTASGSRAAILFMHWLGLNVIPSTFNLEEDLKMTDDENSMWRWLDTPPSPLIYLPPTYDENSSHKPTTFDMDELKSAALSELDRIYCASDLEKFEKDIEYSFKDKAYLVQAFTHNSYNENKVTGCHQRLEFLGDALLDYLITRYLFEDPKCHSPGTLTDLRSALVNNTFFASLAVKYKFHKYLRYISDDLIHVIDGFVKKFRCDRKDTITKGYTLLISEGESEYAEDTEVPKALGDVFESVAGAIYLDSGMSLDQVWEVYFKMMKPEIEYFSNNVPKSPIRELLESMPQNVRFSPSEMAPDKKHRVIAEVFGVGRFIGVGRNKHSAKSTAAKRALRMLALKRKELEELQFESET